MTRRFEILEHTADVGLRATAPSGEALFEALAEGLATILGAWLPDGGAERPVEVEASDREALLVAWLDELLYIHEIEDAVFTGIAVAAVEETRVRARVRLSSRAGRELEGVGVKAATYHRLQVARGSDGTWSARVYLDV